MVNVKELMQQLKEEREHQERMKLQVYSTILYYCSTCF